MRQNVYKLLGSATLTAILFWVLSIPIGPAPPLGPFLNPGSGFWANAVTYSPGNQSMNLENEFLSDSVEVYYDKHQIPHIFASNDKDLYFAQGYVTARDRLWQMEMQTHAAAGRLSEFLGPRTLEYDRYQRRIGMVYAAEQALKGIMQNQETKEAIEAYAAGVNAWIDQLSPSSYPLEYKILNYRPEVWTPIKSALLFKYMTYTLAGSNNDLRMSNTRAFFGDSFISDVLDLDPDWNDPTIPPGTPWDFDPLEVEEPDSNFSPSIAQSVPAFQPDPTNGSNNWAVSGNKTASGYPILANDPHLNMTLPSIWYAIQLHSPNQNAMGVSLPGTPAVIIGFNERIAWGTTNVSADVWDWYEIEFRDSTLSEYRYDGVWRPTRKRVETIKVKGQEAVVDTIPYTHHGPVVQPSSGEPIQSNIPNYHAMRWIAYEESNETEFFMNINRASNYDDYKEALKAFSSPAQNWIFADSSDVALTVTGKYPLKWQNQGRYISDGSNPRYDWQDWIPFEQIPQIKNPTRGFVSSANQDPTDDTYPYYLDDDFAPYERGRRINERLAEMDQITTEDMQALQLDVFSYHAKEVLPVLLQNLQRDTLSAVEQQAVQALESWNYENRAEMVAPSVFKYWWDALYDAIWNDEYGETDVPLSWPDRDQAAYLVVNRPYLKWYDDVRTDQEERLYLLINQSFGTAFKNLETNFGTFGENWNWGYVGNTNINHLANLPGMGRKNLFTGGGAESINAIHGSHGPSWRMVVELGPQIQAYGIYPGGQSGNPGSPYYDNMISDWVDGNLFPLQFFRETPTAADSTRYTITLH